MSKLSIGKLVVHEAKWRDVYRDVARIHKSKRGSIQSGTICRLYANTKSRLVVVRGADKEDSTEEEWIRVDEITRDALDLTRYKNYEFQIAPVGRLQQARWAWQASEPATRVAMQISILSFGLGVVSLLPIAGNFIAWLCRLVG
jgi:hypothetical protein